MRKNQSFTNSCAIILFTAAICILSCGKKDTCYRYDISEIDVQSVPATLLTGTKLPVDMNSGDMFFFIDSLLIIHREYFPAYEVLNKYTFDTVKTMVTKGRARNEFSSNPVNYTKQFFKRNGETIIPLMDQDKCKELNLDKTLKTGFAVIDRVSLGVGYLSGSAVSYGEGYNKKFAYVQGYRNQYGEQILPRIIYIDENDSLEVSSVYSRYPENFTNDDVYRFLNGYLYKQPDGNMVAQPLTSMSYILFYNLEKRKYFAVHIQGDKTFEDGIPQDQEERNSMSFQDDAIATNDFIIVLYWGDYDKVKETDPDYKGRLLMIDWKGNLLKSYILHDWVNRISYDPDTHTLYGANFWFGDFYSFGVIE